MVLKVAKRPASPMARKESSSRPATAKGSKGAPSPKTKVKAGGSTPKGKASPKGKPKAKALSSTGPGASGVSAESAPVEEWPTGNGTARSGYTDGPLQSATKRSSSPESLAGDLESLSLASARGTFGSIINVLRHGSPKEREDAAGVLLKAAFDEDNQTKIAEEGGILPLVELVRDGSEGQRHNACGALSVLSRDDNIAVAIANLGGVAPLVETIRTGTNGQKELACGTLVNMAFDDGVALAIAQSGGLSPLLALAREGTAGQKVRAAAALRNLAYTESIAAEMASLGVAPLVALVKGGSAHAREQAAGCLGNLALVIRNRSAIQMAGGYEALSQLVMEGNQGQRDVAQSALKILAHADEVACVVVKG